MSQVRGNIPPRRRRAARRASDEAPRRFPAPTAKSVTQKEVERVQQETPRGSALAPLRCRCPKCPTVLELPASAGGQVVKCPKCGATFRLAGGEPPAAPPKPVKSVSRTPRPVAVPATRKEIENRTPRPPRRTATNPVPRLGKKLLIVLGGVAAVLLLVCAGGTVVIARRFTAGTPPVAQNTGGNASAAPEVRYSIKLKLYPDLGQSMVVRKSSKEGGTMKFFDMQGKPQDEPKPATKEIVYTETTLEKGDTAPTKFKRVYETSSQAKGDEPSKPFSEQGRTVLFELTDGKFRVGVVGKPPLDAGDHSTFVEKANQPTEQTLLIQHLAPSAAVKVGDSWKLDIKKIASLCKSGQINPDKSTAQAKLVKVYTKDNRQCGEIELKAQLFMEGSEGVLRIDPPLLEDTTLTLDGVIDGTSTLLTITELQVVTGKGKMYQEQEVLGTFEADIHATRREEYSAEKADPNGRDIPVVEFPSDTHEWKEFASKEGRFSANFPTEPTVESKKDAKGDVTVTTQSTTENGAIAFFVIYSDVMGDFSIVNAKEILKQSANAAKADPKSYKEVPLNGYPGLEFVAEIEKPDTKVLMKTRLYLVKNRLYQVIAAAEQSKKDKAEFDKFLDSFRLSEKADETKEPGK